MTNHYDVIIIGTGAGGGTLALALASTGKRILLLERGEFLPREKENWSSEEVILRGRYKAKETWLDARPQARNNRRRTYSTRPAPSVYFTHRPASAETAA